MAEDRVDSTCANIETFWGICRVILVCCFLPLLLVVLLSASRVLTCLGPWLDKRTSNGRVSLLRSVESEVARRSLLLQVDIPCVRNLRHPKLCKEGFGFEG